MVHVLTTSNLEDWTVEPLASHHAREAFGCGVESLNIFLRQQASQNARKGFSQTFVVVPDVGSATIVDYYTLAMGALGFDELPREKHLPHYPIPLADDPLHLYLTMKAIRKFGL